MNRSVRHGRRKKALPGPKWLRYGLLAALVVFAILADRYDLRFASKGDPAGSRRGKGVPEQVKSRAKVIDGDSLRVGGREVRLQGIDAPEGRQMCQRGGRDWACGRRSADRLRALVGRQQVTCDVSKRDQHRRLLATCRVKGANINKRMVREGWAVSYGRYRHEEAAAKSARRGIWSGQFMRPRAWRDRHMRRR